MTRKGILIILLGFIFLLSLAACNDEDDPVCPGDSPADPSLTNIWPHADGTTWFFDLAYQEYEIPFPEEDKGDTSNTDDLPTMAALYADLQNPVSGTPTISKTGVYRLELAGEVTTEVGVTAQNLAASLFFPESAGKLAVDGTPDHFLRMIARARPDLAEALQPYIDPAEKVGGQVNLPFLLNGYAFSAETDGYFGYGDLDAEHSWIYLPDNLEVGTNFFMQLLSSVSDDVFLYGKIWSQGDLVVGGQLYQNVVECMYKVDLGMVHVVDEEGEPLGDYHPYMYGTIHFAPDVGPVASKERWHVGPSSLVGGDVSYIVDYVID